VAPSRVGKQRQMSSLWFILSVLLVLLRLGGFG
jgi:hypothetical protein